LHFFSLGALAASAAAEVLTKNCHPPPHTHHQPPFLTKDFIYSLTCIGGVALSGGGDGILLAHSVASGELMWGLGANEAAVRCIGALSTGTKSRQLMVAAGDDGKALVYDF